MQAFDTSVDVISGLYEVSQPCRWRNTASHSGKVGKVASDPITVEKLQSFSYIW